MTGIHGVLSQPPTQHTLTLPVVYHGKVQTPESMDENLIHSLTTVVCMMSAMILETDNASSHPWDRFRIYLQQCGGYVVLDPQTLWPPVCQLQAIAKKECVCPSWVHGESAIDLNWIWVIWDAGSIANETDVQSIFRLEFGLLMQCNAMPGIWHTSLLPVTRFAVSPRFEDISSWWWILVIVLTTEDYWNNTTDDSPGQATVPVST